MLIQSGGGSAGGTFPQSGGAGTLLEEAEEDRDGVESTLIERELGRGQRTLTQKGRAVGGRGEGSLHLLQDVPVELFLAVAQELPDHLAAEALALEQEMCHPNGRVRDETPRDQELDPFVWISGREGQGR